ncbi:MAG TPA: ATP-binding protein, partial [Saprospiraceae bacterium]|nr:ATP-binding protein [Saprospiraceae bacterium]
MKHASHLSASQAHQGYRYPGARPFSQDQQHLFFGRSQAVRDLHNLLQMEQLVVLHSKSGLGKSSLLNAGLMPRVVEQGRWEPLSIRFSAWTEGKQETPVQITHDLLAQGHDAPTFLHKIFPDDRSLWYAAKTRQVTAPQRAPKGGGKSMREGVTEAASSGQGLLLIFDQFEELFTYPEEAVQAFGRQLAELLLSGVPQRVRKMAELFLLAQPDLLKDEEEAALEQRLDIRIVCAIRSDRMSQLDGIKAQVPQILTNRYELQALNSAEAAEAIEQPAQREAAYVTPVFRYAPAALDTMLGYLTKGSTQSIESFQLQILCQSIEQYVDRSGDLFIEPDDVGNPEQVFRDYYDNQLNLIPEAADQLAARQLIEEGLVYEKEQRRLSLFDVQIQEKYGISEDLLSRLVDTHLIRAEPNLRGGFTYELSHDTLVGPVLKSKARRLEDQRRQDEIEAEHKRQAELRHHEELRQQELREERRKRQRATQYALIGFVLAAISIVTSVLAVQKSRLAEEQTN